VCVCVRVRVCVCVCVCVCVQSAGVDKRCVTGMHMDEMAMKRHVWA
jgi:hypothetical protein